ncbi:hypothetical protein SO802_023929 [Lithocarpus litseifolius]|uniref:Uncharacterized protein n=1 Tax=Lithocarpus litseifolius TaxID=425828 RepID=A0AAW2C8U2_9ROSI
MPFTLLASPRNSHSTATTTNSKLILITSSLTVALAVDNHVLYKLALVPMKQDSFFLAQLTTFGGSNADQMLSGVDFMRLVLMIASSAFQAGASIIKEFVFTDAATRLKGRSPDIFVVNSLGSGFQVNDFNLKWLSNEDEGCFSVPQYVPNNNPKERNFGFTS